ncbi:hypothetical protein BJ322DRAFT_1021190 [Thelephora terrestris]|uniref:Uncharacterized protein n=1 Tax=Thelephora terrestris TaxID=56493 RepID=A0A9P6L6G1_9AGAM|nr:hypothetical protein BJ322DRAFT_1021190 [Thelephora terrestris]
MIHQTNEKELNKYIGVNGTITGLRQGTTMSKMERIINALRAVPVLLKQWGKGGTTSLYPPKVYVVQNAMDERSPVVRGHCKSGRNPKEKPNLNRTSFGLTNKG